MHILFVEDGEMEKRTFLATWKDIPVQNEIQYEIKDVQHNAGLLVFSLKYCLYKQMLCAKSNCEEFNSSFKKTSCKEIGSNQHGLIWKYIFLSHFKYNNSVCDRQIIRLGRQHPRKYLKN